MDIRIEPANFWRDLTTNGDNFPPGFSFEMWKAMLERLDTAGIELYDVALGYFHISLYFLDAQKQLRRISMSFNGLYDERISEAIEVIKSEQQKNYLTTM